MEVELNRLSQQDLSAIFGVTERCLMRWRQFGLPQHGTGHGCYYVWREVLPWYVAYRAGLGDPRAKLPKAVTISRGPNFFHAVELLERAMVALQGEVGTMFKRKARKTPPKKTKPRSAPSSRSSRRSNIE